MEFKDRIGDEKIDVSRAVVIDPSSLARIVGPVPGSLPEVRPAAVLFVPTRPDLAAVGQQALADFLPGRVRPVQFHGVEALDLDGPEAARALDPEELARDLAQAHLADGQPWLPGGARVAEDGVPILGR